MEQKDCEALVKRSIDSWLQADEALFLSCLHENIIYQECYGPVYMGKGQAQQWFRDFHQKGKRVTQWEIQHFYYDAAQETAIMEWLFTCTHNEKQDSFRGCSVIRFKEENISEIREYEMTIEKQYPYQA